MCTSKRTDQSRAPGSNVEGRVEGAAGVRHGVVLPSVREHARFTYRYHHNQNKIKSRRADYRKFFELDFTILGTF